MEDMVKSMSYLCDNVIKCESADNLVLIISIQILEQDDNQIGRRLDCFW